jgi:hypothetical protein
VRTVRNTQIQSVPHRKHHVSATEPNRLMLCGETVAVCCENRTEHTDTVRTSQETHHVPTTEPNRLMLCETHHVPTTEPNRLMLCGEAVAVYCENRTEHTEPTDTSTRHGRWAIAHTATLRSNRCGFVCNGNKTVINIWEEDAIRVQQSSWGVSEPGRGHSSGRPQIAPFNVTSDRRTSAGDGGVPFEHRTCAHHSGVNGVVFLSLSVTPQFQRKLVAELETAPCWETGRGYLEH